MPAATCKAFRGGGVYDACEDGGVNHLVALVGWNDADGGYWIMRNSWGENWADGGYAKIPYHCSQIDDMAIFVNYKATCQPQPNVYAGEDQTIVTGGSTRLGTPAMEGATYEWTPAAGLDDPHAAMPLASPSQTTTYHLKVTTSCGSAEQQVKVAVNKNR